MKWGATNFNVPQFENPQTIAGKRTLLSNALVICKHILTVLLQNKCPLAGISVHLMNLSFHYFATVTSMLTLSYMRENKTEQVLFILQVHLLL